MPISIADFSEPKWVKYQERYPMSYDKNDRFHRFEDEPRSYRGGDFKQAGYNVNHDSTTVEKVRINSDTITLRGY
jgi:hypothetical protein